MPSVLDNSVSNSAYLPNIGMPGFDTPSLPSADELCDELMLHTFECDACINGREERCPTFCHLRERIEEAGGPSKGACLAI